MQIGKWPHFRILEVNYVTLLAQETQGFVFISPKKAQKNLASPTPISCSMGYPFRQKICYPFPQILRGARWDIKAEARVPNGRLR